MLKKLIAVLMLCSVFSVHAEGISQTSLKSIFDELNYSLNVEWDGKDKDFYNQEVKAFNEKIKELQSKGLTNQELIDFVKSQIKDQNVLRDVETAMSMIQINKMSQDEAGKYAMEMLNKTYNHGANWSGVATGIVVGVALLLAVAVAVAIATSSSVAVSNGRNCYQQQVCYDHYDSWGYYWYTDCYWQTYCY